jgi:hypothetical protein
MASEVRTNKISPATGTAFTIGDSGDTFTLPSGATLAVASGATISNAGTASGFGGGKVLQVVNHVYENAEIAITSTSFVDLGTNTDLIITPTSSSNKILVYYSFSYRAGGASTGTESGHIKITRDDTTDMGSFIEVGRHNYSGAAAHYGGASFMYLDSPATTSAVTYSLYGKINTGGIVFHLSNGSTRNTLTATAIELEY